MALFSKKKQDDAPRRRQANFLDEENKESREFDERYSFKRNRTLTGSSSSQISSPGESSAQIKSPRVQAHELARQRRHIGATLLLVLVGSGLLYFLVSQFTATAIIQASDMSSNLDPSYAKTIDDYLSSQPLERFRFVTNVEHLGEYLQSKSPEIASIAIDGSAGLGKSVFTVTLRHPIVGWSINGKQEYVDNSGTSFAHNYFAAPAVQVVDKSGIQVQAGQAIASNRFLGFVGRAVGLTKNQGFTVVQVIIPEGTTREVELQLQGISYPIKLSIDRGVGEQVEDMARAVHWLQTHGQTPQYLDVRVSGEAFYR